MRILEAGPGTVDFELGRLVAVWSMSLLGAAGFLGMRCPLVGKCGGKLYILGMKFGIRGILLLFFFWNPSVLLIYFLKKKNPF